MAIQSLYPAIKPSLNLDFTNVKALDPRITFTRASTATYYDGVTTAKAEENLLTYSEQFDNAAWTKAAATVTADTTTAPDGTLTADSIVEDGTTNDHVMYQVKTNTPTGTYTYSIYIKYVNKQWVKVSYGAVTKLGAYFDVQNGVVGTIDAGYTATITSVGSGWYRCTINYTVASSTTYYPAVYFAATNGTLDSVGDGVSAYYLWGAQLEQRSSVTAYTPTTTQPITNYIPVLQTAANNQARFDHNPTTGESLGLLIEEQRTNLLTYSEQFDNAAWYKPTATISANVVTAPNGTSTADKLVDTATLSPHQVRARVSVIAGVYTISVYVKKAELKIIQIEYSDNISLGGSLLVNSETLAVSNINNASNVSVISVGDSWVRISFATGAIATTANFDIIFRLVNNTGANNYLGNGTDGLYLWGAQLEAGAFPTSYIPTVASQVTRSADAASMTGTNFSQWYNQSEGTMYGEAKGYAGATVGNGSAAPTICTAWQSGYVSINLYRNDVSGTGYPAFVINPSSPEALLQNTSLTFNSGSEIGMVGTYKYNDAALSVNGLTTTTDTLVTLPTPTSFQIGRLGSLYTGYWNGTIKRIAYYPQRLTNEQLQALTL